MYDLSDRKGGGVDIPNFTHILQPKMPGRQADAVILRHIANTPNPPVMQPLSWRFFFVALVQPLPLQDIVDELRDFDARFVQIIHKHAAVLGWWCILHFLAGIPVLLFATGFWWYFMLMGLSWAAINFAIVWKMYEHTYMRRFVRGNILKRFEVQRHVEKMMLFNVGLDAAYCFAGLYLLTLARVPDLAHTVLWSGFGWAVLVQGLFLLIQDNVVHWLHWRNFRHCRPYLERMMRTESLLDRHGL